MSVNADPEFDPLDEIFGDVSFNFCAQDEHVPDIERYVRTVKDHAQGAATTRFHLNGFHV